MQKNFFDPYLLSNLQDKVHTALRNHNKIRLGEDLLVRVPAKFPGVRIIKDDEGAKVEYIYQQWYDPESKQSRNKKATIGRIRYEFPEAMIANDNYEKYFDLETGKPLNPLREPEEEITPKRQPKASQHKSQSTTNQHTQAEPTRQQHTQTKPRPEWTEEEDEEEKRKEAEKRKREEELNANMEKALREIRENAAERRRKEREEKLRGEEEERRKELFADMAIAESIEADNARNDLDDLLRRIAADEPEQTKNEEDHEEKEEKPNHKKEAEPNNKEENPNNTNETESMKETDEREDREDENDRDDEEDLQQAYDEYLASQERIAVLYHIICGIQKTLQVHARKKPDEIINEYKARTINHILEEVRGRYEGTDYLDLLTLVEEPREEQQNGKTVLTGMTYSDAELLLEHYTNILRFIKNAATRPD